MAKGTVFLLLLSSMIGLSTQDRGALQTVPSDGGAISCTGDLVCEQSDMLCIPGDIQTATYPVLVPSDLRAETVKKCQGDQCSLCVQVTVEISADFPTANSDDLGSGDCDYMYYDDYPDDYTGSSEDVESTETASVNVYLQLNSSNNGSLLCANLVIAPPSLSCYAMKVSLPLSAVPATDNSRKTVVGSLVYNCLKVDPGADMVITSYSYPRYSKILSINHEVPGCTELDTLENIAKCETPVLDFVNKSNETSVGIVNAKKDREVHVWIFYSYKKNETYSNNTLTEDKRQYISPSDIAPCICIQAWYCDLVDAVRTELCPFMSYSDEAMLKKSKLEVKYDEIGKFTFHASCKVEAEAYFCWKSEAECREIPNTRRKIESQVVNQFKLKVPHPSLCVQVLLKGKILHTECFNGSVKHEFQNEALIVKESANSRVWHCFAEDGGCKALYNTTHQLRFDAAFLEKMLVKDVLSHQCVLVLSDQVQNISICSLDKYMRSRWTWSRVLCLLVVASVLLILLLKVDDLKKWLKSVTAEKPLAEIFKDRRVLILYSPDSSAYEELVWFFAQSLKELKLDVVLDQWKRNEMAQLGPLPWYQKQKSEAFEKHGLILLLFSEEARDRYVAWKDQRADLIAECDPYGSFGAVLNCVYGDFSKGQAKGRYLVASFSSDGSVVPDPFNVLPVCMLPSNLLKLLQELAGDNAKKLGRKQAKRLCDKIRVRLEAPLKVCQQGTNRLTLISQDGSELSETPLLRDKVAVESEVLL